MSSTSLYANPPFSYNAQVIGSVVDSIGSYFSSDNFLIESLVAFFETLFPVSHLILIVITNV